MKRKFFSIFIIICLICPIMLFVSGCFNNNNSDSSGGQGSGDNSGQTPGIQIPLTPQEKVEVLLSKVYSNFSKNGSVVLGYTAFDIDKEGNKEERTFNNIEKTKIIVDENEETCQFYVHGESSCVYIVKYLSTEDGINQITFDLKTEEYSITDVEDENHLATKKYNWGIYNIDFLKIISNKKNKLQDTYKDSKDFTISWLYEFQENELFSLATITGKITGKIEVEKADIELQEETESGDNAAGDESQEPETPVYEDYSETITFKFKVVENKLSEYTYSREKSHDENGEYSNIGYVINYDYLQNVKEIDVIHCYDKNWSSDEVEILKTIKESSENMLNACQYGSIYVKEKQTNVKFKIEDNFVQFAVSNSDGKIIEYTEFQLGQTTAYRSDYNLTTKTYTKVRVSLAEYKEYIRSVGNSSYLADIILNAIDYKNCQKIYDMQISEIKGATSEQIRFVAKLKNLENYDIIDGMEFEIKYIVSEGKPILGNLYIDGIEEASISFVYNNNLEFDIDKKDFTLA